MGINEEGDDRMQGLDVGMRETVLEDAWCLAWVSDWTLESCITGTEDRCPSGLGMGVEISAQNHLPAFKHKLHKASPHIYRCAPFSLPENCALPQCPGRLPGTG